jgi:hypothetical protein
VLAIGTLVLALAIIGSLSGFIKTAVYDSGSSSPRVLGVGSPLSYTASIDGNAKHIRDGTNAYLAHLDAVNSSSSHIAGLAGSTSQMTANVAALRDGLAVVLAQSRGIDHGLHGLSTTAGAAGGTLAGVGGDSAAIAGLMVLLRSATAGLGGNVRAIDVTAGEIAGTQLPDALAATLAIDRLLPMGVPVARTEPGP